MVLDWPPWYILEGDDKGTGQFNYILDLAQKSLPQYNHLTEEMNWSRFWHEIENTNMCYVFGLKKGNREDLAHFSSPHTLVLPNAIIMRKKDIEKLGNPESYSIATLLRDKRFKGVAEKTRSFTNSIDTVLKKNEQGSNLTRVDENSESLIRMLSAGRIDYTIDYPIVATYFDKKIIDNPGSLGSVPISEMDEMLYVYMSCTKNEWGKKIINEWNEVLRLIKPTEEYRKIVETGYTDDRELKVIQQNYDAFMLAQ